MTADNGKNPAFVHPTDFDILVWRYMDFPKLVSCISKSSLFFIRTSYLDDKYEGSITRPSQLLEEQWAKRICDEDANKRRDPAGIREQLRQARQFFRETSYVNCWHMSEYESVAMWKLYSSTSESVCIQTTYRRLHNLLPSYCMVGCVKYVDFDKIIIPTGNGLYPLMCKRMSFDYEREVRALIWKDAAACPVEWGSNLTEHGIYVEIDLAALSENIYINPECPEWFADTVREITFKYGLKSEPTRSNLAAEPLF